MQRRRWQRMIVHADMDAFYAAVEQLDEPSLRGKPLLVGPPGARGVVLTASYEARPYGVGSAMPMARARRLCPHALVVPPRFERYQAVSALVMDVFRTFSPHVEALSLDEAFLDMTGSERIFGGPEDIGRRLKEAVREATGLNVSVGISGTKYVAKVASGHAKPDGLTIVPPDGAREWLAPFPVSRLWGVGGKTVPRLRALGLHSIGDVAAADPDALVDAFGSMGRRLHELANGRDPRNVEGARAARSIGSELTLAVDTDDPVEICRHLRGAADKVARRLRHGRLTARGVRVKLKRHDFRLATRQKTLPEPSDVTEDLFGAARSLLPAFEPLQPVRLVGLAAFDLVPAGQSPQQTLLGARSRARDLEIAMDRIAERFGRGVVLRASDLVRGPGVGQGVDLDFLRDGRDDDDAG